uniref:Uncharacterized protein n=1 Tax=Eptatretus burgeri TaxID=7764 RepID=A0A8C4QLG4_EPTBU
SVVGRCAVPRDAFPQWRNICWNWDGTLLAHSDSSGHVFIFDLIGNLLFNIVPAAGCTGDLSQAVAGMVFLKCDDDRWSAQLLVITFHGLLTSYLIGLNTSQGYKETHRFSFRHQYPRGINTAVYNPAHRVLLVVGSKSGDAGTSAIEACGLTLWRVLSGPPHYKLIESDYVDVGKVSEPSDAILKLSLSPSGASLAALHESGKLSLWNVPSMTLRHTWHQEQQPDFDVINPVWRNPVNRRTKIPGLASVPLLLDVKWWSEDALILVRCSGALTISSCVDLQNLLGRSCEWFEPSPAISAAFDGGFLTLEVRIKEEDEKRGDGEAEESSVMSRCGRLVRHSLYYITESERFSPPRKRPRSMVHTYRLIKLKSTTPQELYQRKIDSEEYGEALQLAQVYGLDTDLVYQQQWRRKPVSIISIQDYLTKIRKPEWVLHECLERVPENVDAAKELLLYGLEGTGLDALMALADGERHDRFVTPGDLDLPEISYEDLEGEPEIEEELLCRRQQEREKWLLARVNFSNLTLGQRDLCRCRLRLLNFLDRLATYEEILGGPQAAERLYNAEFFKTFRSQNLLVSARNYARSGDWQALETLFLFHGEELRKQRLPLLSCFPETTSPHEYRTLLPEVGFCVLAGVLFLMYKMWVIFAIRALLEVRSGDLCEFIFEEEPELRPFCGDDLSVEQVSSWYRQRACHIEAHSHQVDCALSLLRLGVERGVPGLDDLLEELVTLETLVYEAGAEPTFTLENLQQMEDVARLRLLMLNVSVGDFVRDAFRWLVPFLQRVQARDGSSNSLLHQYLLGLASNDLTCPRLVFQNSTPVRTQRVITDDALLMELALECVYACTRTDQLALCYDILECLPQRKPRKDSKVMKTLHDRVDLLERHLRVVDILEKYGVHRPVSYVRDSQSDVELAQDMLTYLARQAGRRYLMIVLFCFRECLNLIKDHPPAIQEERDLILSLSLLSEFHVKALPLQVRLCEDRLQLIKQCISQSPTIYKCPGKLLVLASLLRVPDSTGDNCGGPVLILLAEQALRSEDLAGASQLCQQLVMKGYQGAWSVCSRVGSCNDCTDTSIRRNFLTFALAHCPPDFLQDLLVKSCSLQAQVRFALQKEDQEMEPEGNKNRFVGWTGPAGKLLQQTTERTVSIFSKSTQSTCEVLQALTQPQWWCKSLAYHHPLQVCFKKFLLSYTIKFLEELFCLCGTYLAFLAVLLQLAEESFPRDVTMGLAYLLAVSESFLIVVGMSFQAHPTEVVQEVLSAVMFPLEGMACPHVQHLVKRLRQACERFADFLQAQSLLNLGCGVDVERFAQDADYKRQTILGLAESLEEEPLQLALTLARRYEVPSWEVFLSHTEFLLADNGLSASEVEERITAQDLPGELRNQPEAVLARLACVVFPSLSGRDHARLCTYFGLLKACGCTSHTMHPGQPEAHFQLLQKLHSIAPGLDYKQLVMGESPLEAVRSELTAQNVSAHVLSIPTDQRSTEEIQNGEIGETEWLFRFSECEQLMHKMDPPDVGTFLQSICASPHAVSQVSLTSFCLVFLTPELRYQSNGISEQGTTLFQLTASQIKSPVIMKIHMKKRRTSMLILLFKCICPQARLRDLVKAYDEACSLPDGVRRVALKLALAAQPVNRVNALSLSTCGIVLIFFNLWIIRGTLVSGEDLLGWLRPFCCDEAVPTMQRARVLQLLDRAFPLEEHDLRLLLCYRTKTVLQHSWPERMVSPVLKEIESEERRLDLFHELLVSKTTTKQLQQLLLLLQAWPAFQPSVLYVFQFVLQQTPHNGIYCDHTIYCTHTGPCAQNLILCSNP